MVYLWFTQYMPCNGVPLVCTVHALQWCTFGLHSTCLAMVYLWFTQYMPCNGVPLVYTVHALHVQTIYKPPQLWTTVVQSTVLVCMCTYGMCTYVSVVVMAPLLSGEKADFSQYTDENIVSGAIKLYLRELPIPLITFDTYKNILKATGKNRCACVLHE